MASCFLLSFFLLSYPLTVSGSFCFCLFVCLSVCLSLSLSFLLVAFVGHLYVFGFFIKNFEKKIK